MAINIEVKHALRALEERIKALEALLEKKAAQDAFLAAIGDQARVPLETKINESGDAVRVRKLCPKCGEKPAYFFHVKYCAGKQKQDGDDRNRDPRSP